MMAACDPDADLILIGSIGTGYNKKQIETHRSNELKLTRNSPSTVEIDIGSMYDDND